MEADSFRFIDPLNRSLPLPLSALNLSSGEYVGDIRLLHGARWSQDSADGEEIVGRELHMTFGYITLELLSILLRIREV